MQTTILDLCESMTEKLDEIDTSLTFKHFINYLRQREQEETTHKKAFFKFVLKKFLAKKELNETIAIKDTAKYAEELSLAFGLLLPALADEKKDQWAICVPLHPIIFYGTDAFYDMFQQDSCDNACSVINTVSDENANQKMIQAAYSFILEKLYNFSSLTKNDLVYSMINPVTGLPKYCKVHIDTRFVQVYAKGELPALNFGLMKEKLKGGDFDWGVLASIMPLSSFRFEGFSIISITDVTSHQAVENIKSVILNRSSYNTQEYYQKVVASLKNLGENEHVEFGLLPLLKVNNKLVFDDESCNYSIMVQTVLQKGMQQNFIELTEQYFKQPKAIFYPVITGEEEEKNGMLKYLKENGVSSYALLPVYYNNNIAGALEVYSKHDGDLTEQTLARLDAALPLLAQLLQNSIDDFDAKIEAVIKDRFTSLQPAVEWKFKDVAWHYLRDQKIKKQKAIVEDIAFKNVYPLYGAIDIRNSTIERNNALIADLQYQFGLLHQTLTQLKQQVHIALADELIFKCSKWVQSIAEKSIDDDHMRVNDFLEHEAHPFLLHFKESSPQLQPIINKYFDATNEATGEVFANRRILENSMQTINSAISQYLEFFKDEVQLPYPCFFEKFRTDGIEYDIYIGQSIMPEKPFDQLYLKNIRLWQLSSMAAIAKITHALLPQLEKELLTTQLIFIRSAAIDISFRNDERRFDVEGTYNIRYQVIKKRIDKVHIKLTGERLTQPGKIALVYFNKREAEEYVEYIHYLQSQGSLENDIEYLELEELQGVNGLKALRVGVKM